MKRSEKLNKIHLLFILLFINPYYIYDVGFQYSFIISYALSKFTEKTVKNIPRFGEIGG